MTDPSEPVGLVGVGAMGLPIAKNLIASGIRVLGFRRSSLAALVAAGGEAARSPAAIAERAGAIIICLPDAAAVARVEPVFKGFIDTAVHVGPFGAGLTMKLVSNLLVAVNNAAAAEAMALADRAGLDRDQVARLVAVSSGSSRQWETRAPQMAARRYAPAIGAVATLEAVLEVIDDTARTLGAATPLYDLARASYARALAEGRGGDDIACLFEDARAAPLKA